MLIARTIAHSTTKLSSWLKSAKLGSSTRTPIFLKSTRTWIERFLLILFIQTMLKNRLEECLEATSGEIRLLATSKA